MSLVKLADVSELVRIACVKFRTCVELEELRRGIRETLLFESLILTHADCVWKLLVSSKLYNVTPSYLQDAFVIHYSVEGSNNRIYEEAVVLSWYDYIYECEGKYVVSCCILL